jgi:pimeloyl-ACP methyl ester carboxylesterase
VQALGERNAVLVGHGWGGLIAWTTAVFHPQVVRRLVIVGTPHPLRLRAAMTSDRRQRRALRHAISFQAPWSPERRLVRDDATYIATLLHDWAAPGWHDAETERRYRRAMQIPGVAHCSLEYYRWAVRSLMRPDGLRYARRMATPVHAPTLQLHGALDPCVLPSTARRSGDYVSAPYNFHEIPDVGHFPHIETPGLVTAEIMHWATTDEH